MRIGILADDALSPIAGGIGQYVRRLVAHLAALAPDDEFVLIYARGRNVRPPMLARLRNVAWCELPFSRKLLHRLLWPLVGWPHVERCCGSLDVVHITGVTTSVPTHRPLIVTIHDLAPEKFPQTFRLTSRLYRCLLLRQARQADALIAVSQVTARDIVAYLGVPLERIAVIHHGRPGSDATAACDAGRTTRRYGLGMPYVFFLGSIHPRKNVERLLEGFWHFKMASGAPHMLVLAGALDWRADRVRALAQSLGLENVVRFLGYVPDEDVPALMTGADAFVYPSLYEGFGLPLLEAMAYRTPIVASNRSSIPEVAGPAARYFDPYDPADIGRALVDVTTDAALRARLVEQGVERVRQFDWERTAQMTLDVYRRVARGA